MPIIIDGLIHQMTSISSHNFRFVGSSVSAIMIAILLFIFPAYPFWKKAENKYDLEGWTLHTYFQKIRLTVVFYWVLTLHTLYQINNRLLEVPFQELVSFIKLTTYSTYQS